MKKEHVITYSLSSYSSRIKNRSKHCKKIFLFLLMKYERKDYLSRLSDDVAVFTMNRAVFCEPIIGRKREGKEKRETIHTMTFNVENLDVQLNCSRVF